MGEAFVSRNIIAFSGGKDSTALALRWAELGKSATLIYTPTGDELPEMAAHVKTAARETGFELVEIRAKHDLFSLIAEWNALPNHRQRWCTRILKIEPCLAWIKSQVDASLLVGLRADEQERKGIYSNDIATRFPLREWGWGLSEVWGYLNGRGVSIPRRTDCSLCYAQRLSEWYALWRNHPERYQRGVDLETETGHTFRSPSRDSWPASLVEMRKLFEKGRKPQGSENFDQLDLFEFGACRVCSL